MSLQIAEFSVSQHPDCYRQGILRLVTRHAASLLFVDCDSQQAILVTLPADFVGAFLSEMRQGDVYQARGLDGHQLVNGFLGGPCLEVVKGGVEMRQLRGCQPLMGSGDESIAPRLDIYTHRGILADCQHRLAAAVAYGYEVRETFDRRSPARVMQ